MLLTLILIQRSAVSYEELCLLQYISQQCNTYRDKFPTTSTALLCSKFPPSISNSSSGLPFFYLRPQLETPSSTPECTSGNCDV
jgi:hypothetical protein